MMAAVKGRVMRRSPAEPAATSCRGAWKRLRSLLTVGIAAAGTLTVDRRVSNGTVYPGDDGHPENPGSDGDHRSQNSSLIGEEKA